ncbi:MAG: DUF4476 domain-containing protein [Ferruginibacter sp.]|nr:DUF4476 domain-containing protein [Chitinophagaceae bacterium]
MKKFFTLLLSSLFSLSLLAYDGSRLSISTISNTMDLKIEIDGRRINMQDNTITLSNITEGSHSVRIYREKKRNGNGFNFGKKQEIIYASSVFVKKGFHTDITVNRFGKVFIDERRMDSRDGWYDEDENYGDYEDENDGGWNNGYGNVMSTRDFEMVKEQIRKEWFEKNRLVSAKVIMDKNNFTVQQVKEFMLLFTFEENKLEVAKYAYRKTVDKQNYYQLNDALTFKSSKDDLARFIRESH